MTKRQHMKNVSELARMVNKDIRLRAERLYRSGGIEPKDYENEGFTLAKILVSAALEDIRANIRLLSDENKQAVRNLSHF